MFGIHFSSRHFPYAAAEYLETEILFPACHMMMAHLLPPVCTDMLKFQNPPLSFCKRNKCPVLGYHRWKTNYGGRRRLLTAAAYHYQDSALPQQFADDYYAVLGLLPDATPKQIKKAYYSCMKACHPDLSGDNPETTNFCMFVNEIYAVLSDPLQRLIYDEIHGYALTATNPFLDDSSPKDHVFVDEFSCIGCKNCANVCSDVFGIEEEYGRARVYSQSGKPDKVQEAVESCPVDCIHWTSSAQLSLLEDEMRRVERVNVGLMLSGMGSVSVDVFRMASTRWEKRQAQVLEQARISMMSHKGPDKYQTLWSNLWGNKSRNYENKTTEKEARERAAAAACRWREYSRRGVDKPPTFKLPESVSVSDDG